MIRVIRRILPGMVLVCGFSAGMGLAEEATFDVTMAGVRVAEMTMTGDVSGNSYDVRVMIRSDGLAGIVKRIRFQARSEGQVASDFAPSRYTEQADTGRRQSVVEITYERGVPQVMTYTSPRPDGPDLVDPATQGGTLDPATALFAGLRDLPAGQECNADIAVFDGRRRSVFALSGNGAVCTGDYRRIAGYTPAEMAERSSFPLEVVYVVEGEVMRVVEASVQTLYGKVRLKRR